MKINMTEVEPLVKTLLEDHPAPGWILAFLATILAFTVVMTIICFKYCPLLTAGCAQSGENANRGCALWCGVCNGCINASTQNCISMGVHYRTCVDTTYECATHRPGNVRRMPRPERVPMRQLPLVRQ